MKSNKKTMYITLTVIIAIILGVALFINGKDFGRLPRGARLERVKNSPNYRAGSFQNLSPTRQITSDKSMPGIMLDFLFRKIKNLRPAATLPAMKTDLGRFAPEDEVLVWMGHSSLFMQIGGRRLLVDPVLVAASPLPFMTKPFKAAAKYTPDDIPPVDYIIISHDHWDHMDYNTIKVLKERTRKFICPLGVGEHMEYWGVDAGDIVELDWNESAALDDGFTVYCLPSRHFSGRGLNPNQTLWASFMLQSPTGNIYISGDGGYDKHFAEIGGRFGIDLAVLEDGQYSEDWRYIHMLPEDVAKAAKDLGAKRIMAVHNSKYALGKHSWREPLDSISRFAERDSLDLITPMIGQIANFRDTAQKFEKWWEGVE